MKILLMVVFLMQNGQTGQFSVAYDSLKDCIEARGRVESVLKDAPKAEIPKAYSAECAPLVLIQTLL